MGPAAKSPLSSPICGISPENTPLAVVNGWACTAAGTARHAATAIAAAMDLLRMLPLCSNGASLTPFSLGSYAVLIWRVVRSSRVARMDRTVALVVAVAIGGVLAAQAPLNSALGAAPSAACRRRSWRSGSRSRRCSRCALLAGGLSGLGRLGEAPLHVAVGGGLIGALYVGSIVWTVRALGAGGLTAATIAGQLALAVVIDHFGWLGVARSPITASKVLGIALLALGTWFVVRD